MGLKFNVVQQNSPVESERVFGEWPWIQNMTMTTSGVGGVLMRLIGLVGYIFSNCTRKDEQTFPENKTMSHT